MMMLINKFRSDARAAAAIMFCFAAAVLAMAAGAAADYSSLTSLRAGLQRSADAAALNGAKALILSVGQTASQREQLATRGAADTLAGLAQHDDEDITP